MLKHYQNWDAKDVAFFVAKFGPAFVPLSKELENAGVSGGLLTSISEADLIEMGLESEPCRQIFAQRVMSLVERHNKESAPPPRNRHAKRHPAPQRRPIIQSGRNVPDHCVASECASSGSPKRRRQADWVYTRPGSAASSSLPPSQRRRSPRHPNNPLPSTAYSASPFPARTRPTQRHIAVRLTPRSTTKPVIDPNHHLLSNVSPQSGTYAHARGSSSRTRPSVIQPVRPSSPNRAPRDPHYAPDRRKLSPKSSQHPKNSPTRQPMSSPTRQPKSPVNSPPRQPKSPVSSPSRQPKSSPSRQLKQAMNSPSRVSSAPKEPQHSPARHFHGKILTVDPPSRQPNPNQSETAGLTLDPSRKLLKSKQRGLPSPKRRMHTTTPPSRSRQPMISATRVAPRPYMISMKATVINSHTKDRKPKDKDPKITIINLQKNPKKRDASLPDSWFGKQGKGLANSSQTSLLSFSSTQRSSYSDPSSAMDSGSTGISRSIENSVSTVATIIEEESFQTQQSIDTDYEIDSTICDALKISCENDEDTLSSSKNKSECENPTEQSEQLTLTSSTINEAELNAVDVTVKRPKTAEEAFLEFSNAIAICVCSLQLGYEYLELLYQLSDRLYGREQVNYDLSQGTITRTLSSNYEFLQLLNLLGFELEGKMLICRQKPSEQVLRVFQKYIREYQYAGFDTYNTQKYAEVLDADALKMLQIVMAVTHDNAQTNEDLTQSFVAFMPYLCDVHTMMELLQFWYAQCDAHFQNSSNVKSAIANVVKHLIQHYKYEVFSSSVYKNLVERIQENDPVGYTHIEAVIREANSNIQTLPFLLQNTISTVSNLLDLSPQTLADNLTLSNFNLFSSIPLVEIFEQNFTTSKLAEFMTRYENIQRWVMITIFTARSSEERSSQIRTFFKVAERMKENQDMFGFFAMFRALHSPEVQSFEAAWKQVFVKKFRSKRHYSKIWIEWMSLCLKRGKGTQLFWKMRPPAIPSIHVISAHMEWIPQYQENSRDAVELFCQLRKLYPFVKKLQKFQSVHYSLKADISVINALEAEFLSQSKMNLWNVRSLYIKALNADSIPIPSDILSRMNRPASPRHRGSPFS